MKCLAPLLTAAAALLMVGCIELDSVVTVNKDGSGTVEETVLMSAQLKAMMASFAQPGAAGGAENPAAALSALVPDQAKAESNAEAYGEGVSVKSIEELSLPDGRGGAKVTYAFTDIRNLKYQPGDAKSDAAAKKTITFTLEGGDLGIHIPHDQGAEAEKPDPEALKQVQEMDPAQMAMMKPMFAGMRFGFTVKFASGIASTDATHVADDTVTIMEMSVDKLFENPEGFKKFAAMMDQQGTPDPKAIAEQFKDIEGIKIEAKESVKVKLK